MGIWSDNGNQLLVVAVNKGDRDHLQIYGNIYELKTQQEGSMTPFPHFENTRQIYPNTEIDEAADRLSALRDRMPRRGFGDSGPIGAKWKSPGVLEIENQLDYDVGTVDRKTDYRYRARWSVRSQVAKDGFVPIEIGPISYAALDDKGREAPWQILPQTDQDRLRIAVRLSQADTVSALLSQNVKPNDDQVANLAAVAAKAGDVKTLRLLLQAGTNINRELVGQESAVMEAILSTDPLILDEMLTGKPDTSPQNSFIAFEVLLGAFQRELQVQRLQPKIALARFEHKLAALLKASFDINARDETNGMTPLILAVSGHMPISIIQPLLAAGADPYLKNLAGKSATDLAADTTQLPTLRILDTKHQYADLLKNNDIPSGSPFCGTWSTGDGMLSITLLPDSSGSLRTLFGGEISWKQTGDIADIDLHIVGANRPNVVFKSTGWLGPDGKTLLFKCKELTGDKEESLNRMPSK